MFCPLMLSTMIVTGDCVAASMLIYAVLLGVIRVVVNRHDVLRAIASGYEVNSGTASGRPRAGPNGPSASLTLAPYISNALGH